MAASVRTDPRRFRRKTRQAYQHAHRLTRRRLVTRSSDRGRTLSAVLQAPQRHAASLNAPPEAAGTPRRCVAELGACPLRLHRLDIVSGAAPVLLDLFSDGGSHHTTSAMAPRPPAPLMRIPRSSIPRIAPIPAPHSTPAHNAVASVGIVLPPPSEPVPTRTATIDKLLAAARADPRGLPPNLTIEAPRRRDRFEGVSQLHRRTVRCASADDSLTMQISAWERA